MIQIKWFARGGQGAFTACRLMALAAVYETGGYAQAFPSFGPERRGAPVMGFTRLDERTIRDHSQVYWYNYGIVVDATLLETQDVLKGLTEDGVLFVNSSQTPEKLGLCDSRVVTFDADPVAREVLGLPISNTAMMAYAALKTGIAGRGAMERACRELLPERILEKNLRLIEAVCQKADGEVRHE